ncbi:hypothetical protein D9611_015101 [Ephemerocybe angulata]|uniref:Uncharacterized protein n=1 Tax=Ephemerocybe angulata TaxID=980116 RepID=A0A8H5C2J1_9AGAR|nr:hypothetical protein D9611_015101 [Tulosesus angulatus]
MPIVLTDDEWDEQRATLVPQIAELFASNKSASELASEIGSIVEEYPTSACTEALASAIVNATHSNPAKADTIIQALVLHGAAWQAIDIDWAGSPATFYDVFSVDFLELLKTILFETQLHQPKRTKVEATNLTLSTALLSAAIIKHGLFKAVHVPYGFAYDALKLHGYGSSKSRSEVLAVGACLQLSTAGKLMMERNLEQVFGKEKIVNALKGLKENGTIKHPLGLDLLDDTIENAEADFPRSYSAGDAWAKVFPPSN